MSWFMKGVLFMKKFLGRTFLGIAWGCTINCLVMLIISFSEGKIYFTANEYLKQLICSAVVGIAFALPTFIYENEKLSQGIKCLIHLGIGFITYFINAFIAGWFPVGLDIRIVISSVLIMIALSFVIYFFFWLYYKNEAKKINQKIKNN